MLRRAERPDRKRNRCGKPFRIDHLGMPAVDTPFCTFESLQ
jgi:hypothetical protein